MFSGMNAVLTKGQLQTLDARRARTQKAAQRKEQKAAELLRKAGWEVKPPQTQ